MLHLGVVELLRWSQNLFSNEYKDLAKFVVKEAEKLGDKEVASKDDTSYRSVQEVLTVSGGGLLESKNNVNKLISQNDGSVESQLGIADSMSQASHFVEIIDQVTQMKVRQKSPT